MNNELIACTLKPEANSELIKALSDNGMQIIRINLSHTSLEQSEEFIHRIRSLNQNLKIMLDTHGPEVRISNYQPMHLKQNDHITINYENLNDPVPGIILKHRPETAPQTGSLVFFMDGQLSGKIVESNTSQFTVKMINSGLLKQEAHMNIEDCAFTLPFLTDIDKKALTLASNLNVEYVNLSFVSSAEDIQEARSYCPNPLVKLIAKIENQSGVDNFSAIDQEADGTILARGDLGMNTGLLNLPFIQKKTASLKTNKPLFLATQMLESMITNPLPTRAEIMDVFNACLDGYDAFILSGETAVGQYPLESLKILLNLISQAKQYSKTANTVSSILSH